MKDWFALVYDIRKLSKSIVLYNLINTLRRKWRFLYSSDKNYFLNIEITQIPITILLVSFIKRSAKIYDILFVEKLTYCT